MKVFKFIFLNCFFLFIFLISIELAYSVFNFSRNKLFKSENSTSELKACMNRKSFPIFQTECQQINSFGARGKEVENYDEYNKKAIVLGESIAFGWGANYKDTWTEKINYKS